MLLGAKSCVDLTHGYSIIRTEYFKENQSTILKENHQCLKIGLILILSGHKQTEIHVSLGFKISSLDIIFQSKLIKKFQYWLL